MNQITELGTHYSWVPNLTGHINFQFLTDNILHEDSTHKINQENYNDNIKYFLINNIDYSDNVDEDKKGMKRDILVRIEEEQDFISGSYIELLPYTDSQADTEQCLKEAIWKPKSDFLAQDKIGDWVENCPMLIVYVDFTIYFDGTISFTFKKNNLEYDEKLSNIPLVTYRAIKSILHKDVFHFAEDDQIINVSSTKHNHEFILNNMLRSLKGYERMIKDNLHDFDIKGDYFEQLSMKVRGIHKYMKSYFYIYNLSETDEFIKIMNLSNNILDSIDTMISVERIQEKSLSVNKELKILAITAFFSSAILISSLIKSDNKFDISEWHILLAFIVSFGLYIFFDGNILKRLTFNKYVKYTKGVKADFFLKDRIFGISAEKWKRRKKFFIIISFVLVIVLVIGMLFKYTDVLGKNIFFMKNDSAKELNEIIEHKCVNSKENKIIDIDIPENKKNLIEENNTMGTEIHIHGSGHQINTQTGNNATMHIGTFDNIKEIVKLLGESNSTEFVELIEEGNKLVINSENNKSKKVNILDWATKITKIDKAGSIIVDKATLLIDSLKDLL